MTFMPNSPEARDVASYIHPQTNPRAHAQNGPTIIAKGEGIWVEDSEGKRILDASAGLWCASLGFAANERIAKVAYDQMRKLGYYQTYRGHSNDPVIDLTEKLLKLAPVPMLRHTEFPHWYRNRQEGESEEAFATRMAEALEKLILAEGPETVAAFFAEPVMGAGG